MAHLKYLGLKNFRVFDQDAEVLEFKPITLITGANNSGKSSIIKAILLLQNSIKKHKFLESLDLSEGKHYLGNYGNILSNKDSNIIITLSLPILFCDDFVVELEYKGNAERRDFEPELIGVKIYDLKLNEILLESIRKVYEEPMNYQDEHEHVIYEIDGYFNYFAFNKIIQRIYEKWGKHEAINKEEKNKEHHFYGRFYNKTEKLKDIYNLHEDNNDFKYNTSQYNEIFDLFPRDGDFDIIQEAISVNAKYEIRKTINITQNNLGSHFYDESGSPLDLFLIFFPLERSTKKMLSHLLNRAFLLLHYSFEDAISHLPSVRGNLSRIYSIEGDDFNKLLNRFIILISKQKNNYYINFINKWIKKFEIGGFSKIDINPLPEYNLNQVFLFNEAENKKTPLVDLGYGTLQLLVVMFKVITEVAENEYRNDFSISGEFYKPAVIIIEEPEANLHPKWQSLLADMFVDAVKEFNIQFILETHSEYMIRKFQNLVADKTIPSNDAIVIYYMRDKKDANGEKKQVEKIYIEEDGSIDYHKFDGGFFDEQYELNLSLLNFQREKFYHEFEELKNKSANDIDTIASLEERIDEYTKNKDIKTFRLEVYDLIGGEYNKNKISLNSIEWLASANFLFKNAGNSVDFSPVTIQCGRIIENELLTVFKPFFSRITGNIGYRQLAKTYEQNIKQSMSQGLWPHCMKPLSIVNGLNSRHNEFSLSQMMESIEALSVTNATSITPYQELETVFSSCSIDVGKLTEIQIINDMKDIIDFRDKGAHTYGGQINKSDAERILKKTETFVKTWVQAKR